MKVRPNLSNYSIYRETPKNETQNRERADIFHLLWRLDDFVKFEDVRFHVPDPPDFIFKPQGGEIGVELTDVDPKIFTGGGNRVRGEFKSWQADVPDNGVPHVFDKWGQFTVRDSLDAFRHRFVEKQQKIARWPSGFSEKWLLMHLTDGSPFKWIVCDQENISEANESTWSQFARIQYLLNEICLQLAAFDKVLVYHKTSLETNGCNMLSFPRGSLNTFGLPEPSSEMLMKGANATDEFLDRKWWSETVQTVRRIK